MRKLRALHVNFYQNLLLLSHSLAIRIFISEYPMLNNNFFIVDNVLKFLLMKRLQQYYLQVAVLVTE